MLINPVIMENFALPMAMTFAWPRKWFILVDGECWWIKVAVDT